jgi:retinol dehydrogenase 12
MRTYSKWTRYAASKLANILFTTELARRYPTITSVAIHPGGVETNLMSQTKLDHPWITTLMWPLWMLFHTNADQGAWGQVWAATAPIKGRPETKKSVGEKGGRMDVREVSSGGYYVPLMKEGTRSAFAKNGELAKELWEWTEQQLRGRGY